MKKMLFYSLFFPISYLMISCGVEKSLSPSVLAQLENTERAMFEATSNGDSATFRKLCGADYFTINANGEAHTLAETLPHVPRFKGSTNKVSEQRQRIYGNFVVRNGLLKAYFGGQQVAEVLYTTGWIYRDHRWQFVHWQGTMTGMMLEQFSGKVSLEPPPAE